MNEMCNFHFAEPKSVAYLFVLRKSALALAFYAAI